MSHVSFVRYPSRLELGFTLSVMLSVGEIVDVLYQEKKQYILTIMNGQALRLRISFH
jgi:hypothetical protein